MKILVDTHLLLWSTVEPDRLPESARLLLEDLSNELDFSSASIWEIAIKAAKPRSNITADARAVRDRLIEIGYRELPITSEHTIAAAAFPTIHKDPFDRLLLSEAVSENLVLMTSDSKPAQYKGPLLLV